MRITKILMIINTLIFYIINIQFTKMDNKYLCIVLILVLSSAQQSKTNPSFPHFIWTFWEGDGDLFVNLCSNNIRHYAELNGWQFNILNFQSIEQHLGNETRDLYQKAMERLERNQYHIQKVSDIIRTIILYQKGGIWVDASTMFISNLDWLQNIKQQSFFYDRISDYPQIIYYTHNLYYGGNKTIIFDEQREKQVYLLPGMENWIIISQAKCQFLADSITLMKTHINQAFYLQYRFIRQYTKNGYSYGSEAQSYFFFANFHTQTVLQKKQRQIDLNSSLYDTRYAIEHYRMWFIRAQSTAFKNQRYFKLFTYFHNLFYSNGQDLEDVKILKFISMQRDSINQFIGMFPYLVCWNILDPPPKTSIIYQYALRIKQNDSQLTSLKRLYESPQEVCEQMLNNTKIIIFKALIKGFAIFSLFSFILCKCLDKINCFKLNKTDQKEENNNQAEMFSL